MASSDELPYEDPQEFWESYFQADLAELARALRRHGPRFAAEAASELAHYLKERQTPPPPDDKIPF